MARLYFAFISVTLLALSALAVYQEAAPEWKQYQRSYYNILARLEPDVKRAQEIAGTSPEIKQIYNERYGIVDRCITCHISYEDGRFATEPHPLRSHPGDLVEKHRIEAIGCAVCHDGNGFATSVDAAHGREKHAERPLLTGVWVQSRCARCHPDGNVKGASVLRRGLDLIDRVACNACHDIEAVPETHRVGPSLDGIKHKVWPSWLKAWLENPNAYLEKTFMPHFDLSERQALAITAYLLSIEGPVPSTSSPTRTEGAGAPDLAEGERLFKEGACSSCHPLKGNGGSEHIWAPDLGRIGEKVKGTWLADWLMHPQHFQPGSIMPGYGFSEQEAISLARYLTTTFVRERVARDDARGQIGLMAELGSKELIAEGRTLLRDLGCGGCHAVAGKKAATKIAPELSDVGDWDEHHLPWGDVDQQDGLTLRDFLRMKLESPRAFGENTKMPRFDFSPEDIEAVVVALQSFSENPLPKEAEIQDAAPTPPVPMPAGEVGRVFERYRCLTCHSLRGRFGRMAPDLAFEGDKVQKGWLVDYLRSSYFIRPKSKEKMPMLRLQEEEIRMISDFIDVAWKDDRVSEDPFRGERPPAELVAKGEELYNNEYACVECHSIGGDGGEEGPKLDLVGERLKPGWIYHWVMNPQLLYENEMVDEDVTDEHARALSAFLMSLKR